MQKTSAIVLAAAVHLVAAQRTGAQEGAGPCFSAAGLTVECSDEEPGTFRIRFRIENQSDFEADRLFLWPEGSAALTPESFIFAAVPPGGESPELELTVEGAVPGQELALEASLHESASGKCCVRPTRVRLECRPQGFIRGDGNADGQADLSDAINILNYLFRGAQAPPCLDSIDSNDSGALDISDGISLLTYLFLGGPAPPAPGPTTCGPDPTDDPVSCDDFPPCV